MAPSPPLERPVEPTTNHMREQTELTAQAKQLAEMAQKLMPRMGDFKWI